MYNQGSGSYGGIFSNFVLLGVGIAAVVALIIVITGIVLAVLRGRADNPEKNMEPESADEAGKPVDHPGDKHE